MNGLRIVHKHAQRLRISSIFCAFIGVVSIVNFAACARHDKRSASSPTATLTEQTFTRNCAICHGAHGEGKIINNLTVPSLREGRAVADSDAQLMNQITNGGNGMPPFRLQLSSTEIANLVKYIRGDLQKKSSLSQSPARRRNHIGDEQSGDERGWRRATFETSSARPTAHRVR